MTSAVYTVTGMTCDHCVHAVSEELRNLDGVRDVKVNLIPDGKSVVMVDSDHPVTEEAVAAALDDAGDYHLVRA